MTTVKPGTVLSYDLDHGRGVVDLSGEKIPFGSTYFRSGRPTRDPKEGDEVEVVFSGGSNSHEDVLLVRPRRRASKA